VVTIVGAQLSARETRSEPVRFGPYAVPNGQGHYAKERLPSAPVGGGMSRVAIPNHPAQTRIVRAQIQHLAILAIGLSIFIAGCSLTTGVAGSHVERRRPFSLLRLTGTPLRTLRRTPRFRQRAIAVLSRANDNHS